MKVYLLEVSLKAEASLLYYFKLYMFISYKLLVDEKNKKYSVLVFYVECNCYI